MASESEAALIELLRGERGGPGFFPILVGLMGRAEAAEGERIVLVNPMTQGMVVLQGDAGLVSEILSEGGTARMGPLPASKASIEAMRTVEVGEEEGEGEECPVCLDGMRGEEEETVKEMPCRHRFHEGCIGKWLGMHGSCPVCRFRMPEEEEVESKKSDGGGEEAGEERQRGRREVWITIAIGGRGRRESGEGGDARTED